MRGLSCFAGSAAVAAVLISATAANGANSRQHRRDTWLANTASLLRPVSNLTNLLAEHALGFSDPARFAALMAVPAVVAIVVPVVVIAIVARGDLLQRYQPTTVDPVTDRPLFVISAIVISAIVVVALLPLLVSGLPVWMPASAAAVVLLVAFAVRRRAALRFARWCRGSESPRVVWRV